VGENTKLKASPPPQPMSLPPSNSQPPSPNTVEMRGVSDGGHWARNGGSKKSPLSVIGRAEGERRGGEGGR
jgi:hypothetical protein